MENAIQSASFVVHCTTSYVICQAFFLKFKHLSENLNFHTYGKEKTTSATDIKVLESAQCRDWKKIEKTAPEIYASTYFFRCCFQFIG